MEEGELLSEVDTDEEDNSEVGQLQPTVPDQVQADPNLDASVPNRPCVKPRLRSVASTVQVSGVCVLYMYMYTALTVELKLYKT